ncbi:modular serine protease-like [Condylostylus longicornis]|uniref:modular serine protease-like n=1 Tax=Condylostylus longicornis TaxID=2530218 RepID=UPI00244DC99B|nr:modular serine protease-like [Condylostylus longicornis]
MHTCGGTIVQSKIVLSAAHCFWNDEKSLFYDKSKYIVTAGKFHLDYNSDKETFEVQRVLISKIDVPKTFRGSENNFEGDIAVLTLDNHIKFSDHVIPICVLWSTGFGQFNPNGLSGYVVGFNSNDSSTNGHLLREVPLTGIDTQKCQKYENVANYKIPDDKFCAYSENKTENICSRDGGGAFTIYDRGQLWLGGIFSNIITPNTSYHSGCDETLIRTFTNIYSHESFIKNVISNLSQAD